jgi:integrase
MSLWKRGRQYWTDFTVAGRRYRKRLGTTNLRTATRRERELVEEAGDGRLAADEQGPKRLSDATDAYLAAKRIRCSPRTIELEEERLSLVKKHFGDVPLAAITATAIAEFQRTRHEAGIANRTINMDVGVLSRVLKFCGRWRALADHVKNLPERQRPVGRALTPEERKRLFDAAALNAEWEHVFCAAVVAANTSMRPVEVKHLRRCDVDLVKRLVHVRRSKNETSHRVIPLNASAIEAAARMFERADLLGHTKPEHYLWPACQWGRYDATNPMLKWDTAWRALRDAADLPGLRFHDLRHTVITELAEMGVADHVLESISGHLSRRMLEHYSHIRIDAKRQALDALDAARRSTAHNGDGNGNADDADQKEIPAIVEVSDDLTSQSRHSLLLQGSPPSGKLLIPLNRRDVRVVEGARLESVCRGNSTEGSNPSLSANFQFRSLLRTGRTAYCKWDREFRDRRCSSKAPFRAIDAVASDPVFCKEIRRFSRVLKSFRR